MKETATAEADVLDRLRTILGELLVLDRNAIRPESLLVVDLQLDSLGFIELAFTVEKEFEVEFPDLKTDNGTLVMPLPEGLRVIEGLPGGTTFFEFVKAEAVHHLLAVVPPSIADEIARDAQRRETLFEQQTATVLAAALGGRVPDGIVADAPLATLRLSDLFRFLTLRALATYVAHLVATRAERCA